MNNTTPTQWKVITTHGIECQGCNRAAGYAVDIAKATGSTGATHTDGLHVANVQRVAS